MKVYKNFEELASGPKQVYNYFLGLEDNTPHNHLFMNWYGGDIHVVESIDDLEEIKIFGIVSEKSDLEWASLNEIAGIFEICSYLPDKSYVNIFTATNDSGGPTYFIPAAIAEQCPTLLESIVLSKE